MATEQDKAQVFDLIQRVMKAADNDLLWDESQGKQILGFQIRQWVEEPTPHAKIPHREITTGIPILDQSPTKEHVSYAATNRPDTWGVAVRRIGYLVCIRQAEIEALYGRATRFYAPPHGQRDGVGTYEYVTQMPNGMRVTGFDYITRDNGVTCLNNFSTRITPENIPPLKNS